MNVGDFALNAKLEGEHSLGYGSTKYGRSPDDVASLNRTY